MTHLLVIGLGVTGVAVVDHARAAGHTVTVIEDHADGDAFRARAEHATAAGASVVEGPDPDTIAQLVGAADLVVPSPGVHPDHPAIVAAQAAGVPLRSEVDLAVEELRRRGDAPLLVAVTGTNGKTTVTTLIAEMLAASGVSATAAGNIGRPLIEAAGDDVDVVVAEVSSFQLDLTTDGFAPDVAVLLNVAVDHIDWHGSREAYAAAKAKVFTHQHADQVLIVNVDDPSAADLTSDAPGRVIRISTGGGPHDEANARVAAAAAEAAGGHAEGIAAALEAFRKLPHRLQLVAEIDGVSYYDDSKATNAHATASALRGLDRVVLIAGGRNRSRDLDRLKDDAHHLRAVVAIGEAAAEVERIFTAAGVTVVRADSMHTAVQAAARHATPGDVVLLSPACASLDWYANYTAHGDDFAQEVAQLRSNDLRPDTVHEVSS